MHHLKLYILFFFITTTAYSQQFVTIRGNVAEEATGLTLPGASVLLLTQDNAQIVTQAVSNEFGDFTLKSSLKGNVNIEIRFIGFEKKIIPVTIANTDINLGVNVLSVNSSELGEVVINTSLEEKQRALNTQRNADNIKNVISSDLIGRFPDVNVAEALQRVPGINIQRDKGEGATVSVRGTPEFFTTIQINGEQIPSVQQNGARNEALDLIPADQLGSMEVTKAATPDMDGDAIGGVINLKTPVARKKALGIRAETALGYNDLSGKTNGIGKLRFDKRFFGNEKMPEGKLGIIAGGSFYQNNNSEDRVDGVWGGLPVPVGQGQVPTIVMQNFQYRKTDNLRTRMGLTGTVDYKFNSDNELVFNYMFNQREDNDVRNRLRFDLDESTAVYESIDSISGARIRRDINLFDELKVNHSFNLLGSHNIGQWKIDWGAYYTKSKRTFTSQRGDFAHADIDVVADNAGGIYNDMPQFRTANGEQSMYDPFLYSDFRRYEEDYETTDADNIVGKVDVTRNYNIGNYSAYVKVGGKYRSQSNAKFRNNQVFAFNDPNNILNTQEAFLRTLSGKEPSEFFYSGYRFGPLIGENEFKGYIDSNRRLLTTSDNAWDAQRLSLGDTYKAGEDITAAYAMTRIQFNKLMVLAGVRFENTKVNYDAFEVIRVGTNVQGTPIQGGSNYSFVLPNLHLKYNLDEYTQLRFSTVFNYARPNFVDIVPFVNYDSDAITLRLGNPDLRPAQALNMDLMFEKYFSNVGIISVGVFYKNIDHFQFSRIDPSLAQDFPGYPSTQGFQFRQEQNGENATVAGIEVNFVRSLNFLPGFLKKLSVDGNYTYAYSDAFTQDRKNIALPGQADHTFNAALSGDYGKFSARISANYNGTFINSLASQAQDDIYQDARLQMDANASYQVSKSWRLFAEFVNITNEQSLRYQGSREKIAYAAYFGWQARIGISYRL